jgi:hypothetical protein
VFRPPVGERFHRISPGLCCAIDSQLAAN